MSFLPDSTYTSFPALPVLPAKYAVALQPWFSEKIIRQGFDILRNEQVSFFVFLRRFGGMTFADDVFVTVQMAGKKGRLPFVFRDGNCSKCGWKPGGGDCIHVAALALLSLREKDDTLHTVAELFPHSPWQHIGKYLYEQVSMRRKIELSITVADDGFQLCGTSENGLQLTVFLSSGAVSELAHSLPDAIVPAAIPRQDNSAVRLKLLDDLVRFGSSSDEKQLAGAGLTSKKQKYESSIWYFLVQLLFLHTADSMLAIRRDTNGKYCLLCKLKGQTLFSLLLPRDHSWELLNKLSLPDLPPQSVAALQFSRVLFCPDSADVEVIHCCRLPDGTEYTLSEISKYRFGHRYHIDEVLFSLQPVVPEERIGLKKERQLSLFSMDNGGAAEDEYGFIVQEKNVIDFLRRNRKALHCERHQVAAEILEMNVVSVPEQLVLVDYEEDLDWCYLAGWYGMGNRRIRLDELLTAAADGRTLLPGKTWLDLENSPLAWFHQSGADRVVDDRGRIRLSRGEFLALSSQIKSVCCRDMEPAGTLAAFLQSGSEDFALPPVQQAGHLRSYQRHGCNWLYQLYHYRLGGILADDMGLGKTHQALGVIDMVAEETSRFLIVCPAAVLYHWPEKQREFFPQLSLAVYHGAERDFDDAMQHQVIVSSYGVMRHDAGLFSGHRFQMLIFDEMHVLKNKKSVTYGALLALHAETVIGLTGTPVENNVQELESLLARCMPQVFTAPPIQQRFKYADTQEQRQQLQQLVSPFILRRTRGQVLKELPECSEDIRICELSADQVEAYREAAEEAMNVVEGYLNADQKGSFTNILVTITRLKQICNHLCQLEKSTDYTHYKSGKWDEFTRLIKQSLESGLKVVVFSQFTTMLDIIEQWLTDEQTEFVDIRGSIPAKERSSRISHFNTDEKCKVCCASLLAGGTGIDLTGAQVVVHYDRWWNPAKEEQATARVHRMGQAHPVQVYKLVTAGTIEEKLHGLIEKKRALAADLIVEDDASVLKGLQRQDLAGLFQFTH